MKCEPRGMTCPHDGRHRNNRAPDRPHRPHRPQVGGVTGRPGGEGEEWMNRQSDTTQPPALPFGRHKGLPLAEVPASYLLWCLRECKLSSGLRAAVAGELARRGVEAPAPPEPRPVPPCRYCGGARFVCRWQEDRRGGRRLRAECALRPLA